MLELLQKPATGPLNKKQKEFIEKIYDSNERMIALVNDLLEVTKIEEGQAKLFLQPTDMTTALQQMIREKEKDIKAKDLQINFIIEQEPFPLVRTELNKIRRPSITCYRMPSRLRRKVARLRLT